QVIRDEFQEIIDKYGDERKTDIVYASEELNPEDFYADDETSPQPESGQLALQIQPAAKNTALARLAQAQTLYWQTAGDHVRIRDEDGDHRANIRQEWLIVGGEHYQLNDLEGSL
ncbi:MAG: hypothetical protein ACFNNL_05035, partial [Kingella oralis]